MLRRRTWLFWAGRKPLMHQGAPCPSPTALSPPPMVPTGGRAVVLGLQTILPGHKCRVGKGFQRSSSCPAPCSTLSPAVERKGGGFIHFVFKAGTLTSCPGKLLFTWGWEIPGQGFLGTADGQGSLGLLGSWHPPPPLSLPPLWGQRWPCNALDLQAPLCPRDESRSQQLQWQICVMVRHLCWLPGCCSRPPTAQSLGRVGPAMSRRKDTCRCSANRPP